MKKIRLLTNGISLGFTEPDEAFIEIAKGRMKRAVDPAPFHFCIYRKSVDARRRDDIRFVCSVMAVTDESLTEAQLRRISSAGFGVIAGQPLFCKPGSERLAGRPLIVGCGPAGMFCGLMLAEKGFKPLIIDRGGSISERKAAYERLCRDGVLDSETNIQFGAGGAGTFSDGKLTTRINDPRCATVLSKFAEFGAGEDITVKAKPHIGTDVLEKVVENLTDRITALGGELILSCRLDGLMHNTDGGLTAITTKGDFSCGAVVIATGHSATDTYRILSGYGLKLLPKPFSVGVRIEHLQDDIDTAMFGKFAGDKRLGHAEYSLSDTTGRGVYTFCMCPGGEVVGAATEENGVVVNGMSRRARDGKNSNSAIAVTVNPADYGSTVDGSVNYRRSLEAAAYRAGGGKFSAPVQTVGDFLEGKTKNEPDRVQPSYMGGGRCRIADLAALFPDYITEELRKGIKAFGRRIDGFDAPDACLTGVETRTSSPVRIVRESSLTAEGESLIYPCGEGAGYAGGITSAAVDGIRVAEAIFARFAPQEKENL